MPQFISVLHYAAGLAVVLPLTLLATACDGGGGSASGAGDTGGGDNAGGSGGGENPGSGGGDNAGSGGGSGGSDATSPKGPAPVILGAAGDYVILAKSAVSNVPTSVVTGNIGLSPAAASFITGFSLTREGTKWTSPQVIGGVFAADSDPPTPTDLTTVINNMQTAYTDAAGRPTPDALNLEGGAIGGLTITPGLYKWTSTVTIPSDVEISGAQDDVWIFQITGDLKISSAQSITLSGGAQARNIFWQVAGSVDIGATSHAEGIVLSKTTITMGAGASVNGRLFAQTAVDIASSTVTAPKP